MAWVRVNDISIYYEVRGQGPPLIMIMGLSAHSDWWGKEVIDDLSRDFQLIIFDNRGAGRSDKPAIDYSMEMFADDVAGLLDALRLDRVHVLGHSMGGMIAQEFALRHPHRLQKLILASTMCGGASKYTVQPAPEVAALLVNRFASEEELKQGHIKLLFSPEFARKRGDVIEEFWRRVMVALIPPDAFMRQVGAIMRFDSYDRLPQITVPTLVMTGDKDILVVPQNSEILASRIPGAELKVFPGTGHCFFWEVPEDFCREVRAFLQR